MKAFQSGLWLVIPAIVMELAVLFAPMVYVGVRSFYDWQPSGVSTYVGLENYWFLLGDPEFWQIIGNQAFYLLGLPLWVLCPMIVAYMLKDGVWMAGMFLGIYFLPAIMSPAIVGLVFRSLLATDGTVNAFLQNIGLEALILPWLTDPALVKPVIILMVLWAGFGTGVLIFTSAFQSIPRDILEAAKLDGARFWQEFYYIAVPAVRNTIVLWTMFQVVAIFLFMFGWIYVLTGGGPGLASATMDFSIYQQFIRFGFYGTAAAQSVILILLIVAIPIAAYVFGALIRKFTRNTPPDRDAAV